MQHIAAEMNLSETAFVRRIHDTDTFATCKYVCTLATFAATISLPKSTSVLRIVGPKCTLAVSHAAPW